MTPLDIANKRIGALEQLLEAALEEARYYKRQVGVEGATDEVNRLMVAGLRLQGATLMSVLYRRYPRFVSAGALAETLPKVKGSARDTITSEQARVQIHWVRARIGAQMILNQHHAGYRLSPEGKAWVEKVLSPSFAGVKVYDFYRYSGK